MFARTRKDQRNSPVNRQYLIKLIRSNIEVPGEHLLGSRETMLTYGMSELQGSFPHKAQRLLFVYGSTSSFIFGRDDYHQPSVSNLSLPSEHVSPMCMYTKKNPNRLLTSSHTHPCTGRLTSLINQSISKTEIQVILREKDGTRSRQTFVRRRIEIQRCPAHSARKRKRKRERKNSE